MDSIAFHQNRAMAAMTDPKRTAISVSQNTRKLCSKMLQLSSAAPVNTLHVCAVAESVATMWTTVSAALAKSPREQQQRRKDVEDCMTQLLRGLQPMLPQLTARHASGILMSLSMINMPLTEHLRGLAVKLTQKLATGDADARDIARALSALAQWDTRILHDHTQAAAMRAMTQRFASSLLQSVGQKSPTSKDIAQFLMSTVKLKLRPNDEVLDAASAHIVALIQRPSTHANEARSIALALQSLYQLHYLPTTQQASHLLKQFVMLYDRSPPGQLELRDISSMVVAAAGSGFTELKYVIQGIGLQVIHTEGVSSQNLCTVCRSMAMLNVLDLATLEMVLNKVHAQGSIVVTRTSLKQLYQALYSLQPFPHDSKAMHTAWEGAYQRMNALGPEKSVLLEKRSIGPLNKALASLQLRHRTSVRVFPNTADAVLHQKVPGGGPVLVVVVHVEQLLINRPDRYAVRVLSPP